MRVRVRVRVRGCGIYNVPLPQLICPRHQRTTARDVALARLTDARGGIALQILH